MIIKEFSDGSVMTGKDLAATYAAGAALAAVLAVGVVKYHDWQERRIMKKYGWPTRKK